MKDGVLVVIDMQNDFIDGALGTAEAQSIVPSVVEKIESWDGPVFATMDTHHPDYLETGEGRHLPVPHCICGTKGWEIRSEVLSALKKKGGTVITKGTFGSTVLPSAITGDGNPDEITRIELVGLCTDICVVSNALILKAHFPEADIAVDAGCCAGVTVEKHLAALETMRSCQIDVING